MAAASLRALLEGAIDYAGLFPPANLELAPALENHARYVRSADAWMLGVFILPLAKFDDASANLSGFDVHHALKLSALGAKTDNVDALVASVKKAKDAINGFNLRHGASASISQMEVPLPASAPLECLKKDVGAFSELALPVFWEASVDDAERTIAIIAEKRQTEHQPNLGYKLRTGGVIASAFPSCIQVARALVAAAKRQVPIKFTAGLHHPVRQFHSSVGTEMHGFLNVLGAGVLAAEHDWDVQQTATMLEELDVSKFSFNNDEFQWREWRIPTDSIRARRAVVTSLGSCSFDEPLEDLRALNLF